MAIQTLFQSVGGSSFPLREATVSDSLAPLDHVRERLLALFKSAINYELGEVWRKVTSTLPADSPYLETFPVHHALALRPSKQLLQQLKIGFPLMCLHSDGEVQIEQYLMDSFRERRRWALHYILGPGDVEVERKLTDVTTAIRRVIALVIRQRGHSSYESGALQFFPEVTAEDGTKYPGTGALQSIEIVGQSPVGQAVFGDDDSTTYWATTYTLETTETAVDLEEGFADLVGIDVDLGLADSENTLPSFAQGSSDVPVE